MKVDSLIDVNGDTARTRLYVVVALRNCGTQKGRALSAGMMPPMFSTVPHRITKTLASSMVLPFTKELLRRTTTYVNDDSWCSPHEEDISRHNLNSFIRIDSRTIMIFPPLNPKETSPYSVHPILETNRPTWFALGIKRRGVWVSEKNTLEPVGKKTLSTKANNHIGYSIT